MERGMLWVGALLLATTGCGRSGVLEAGSADGESGGLPLPHGAPEPGAGEPSPPPDVGRGLDGSIVFQWGLSEIDDCVPIELGSADTIDLVGPTSLFATGRRVLVLQMNDAIGNSGPTTPVTNFGRAGQWEIAEVSAVSTTTLTLATPLAKPDYTTDFPNGYRAQACLVREYDDVTVKDNATVAPRPWDGNRGGVLAWQVRGTLTVDGHVSANASGFRGGVCGSPETNEDVTPYDVPLGKGGGKGEGLDSRFFLLFGRGAVTNGGGGGNGLNAGGGGGGGAGRGGSGGEQTNANGGVINVDVGPEPTTRGLAGGSAADASRLIFGGGGGAGHLNGMALSRCGGAGGGILLLSTDTLAGAGAITADGESAPRVERDGGGGGGAGGTIDLSAASAAGFTGEIAADGGRGANVQNNSYGDYYGPGGGGGGGRVTAKGVSATIHAAGGREGLNETGGVAWDADDGEPGITLFP